MNTKIYRQLNTFVFTAIIILIRTGQMVKSFLDSVSPSICQSTMIPLFKKLPTTSYSHHIGLINEDISHLCIDRTDTLDHSIYTCRHKNSLTYHSRLLLPYILLNFSILSVPSVMYTYMYSLELPFSYRSYLYKPFFVTTATAHCKFHRQQNRVTGTYPRSKIIPI